MSTIINTTARNEFKISSYWQQNYIEVRPCWTNLLHYPTCFFTVLQLLLLEAEHVFRSFSIFMIVAKCSQLLFAILCCSFLRLTLKSSPTSSSFQSAVHKGSCSFLACSVVFTGSGSFNSSSAMFYYSRRAPLLDHFTDSFQWNWTYSVWPYNIKSCCILDDQYSVLIIVMLSQSPSSYQTIHGVSDCLTNIIELILCFVDQCQTLEEITLPETWTEEVLPHGVKGPDNYLVKLWEDKDNMQARIWPSLPWHSLEQQITMMTVNRFSTNKQGSRGACMLIRWLRPKCT